jgi:hypothetical protein
VAIVSSALLRSTDFDYQSVYQRKADDTMAKRYQSGNQNLYIKEKLTTQWPKLLYFKPESAQI